MEMTEQEKMTKLYYALLGSSTLFYLTKHDGRGGRRRSISPHHWPRKFFRWTSSDIYTFFFL